MQKRIIGFMILVGSFVAPLSAGVYKTRQEIVEQMVAHENLLDDERIALSKQLWDLDCQEMGSYGAISQPKIDVNGKVLRTLKPFSKKPGNPLFKECLLDAIHWSCNNRVRKLVNSFGVDANTVWEGRTALHEAMVAEGDQLDSVSIVTFLLDKGAALEVYDQQDGLTPLGYAVMYVPTRQDIESKKEKIAALLAQGANFNAVNAQGESMLQVLERGYNHYCRITQHFYQGMGKEVPKKESLGFERTRKNVDKIYEIPAVAEKIMGQEEPVLGVFLPKSLGSLVMEYEHPHLAAVQPYTGEDYERDMAPFFAQRGDAADGGPEQDSVGIAGIGAAGAPAVGVNLAGASVFDSDEELEGEPAGVPYLS
jgi:hypothetical protein